ncbi:hypothetical protein MMC08_002265 [Hypocenomyce scalaris]|nr:hypothetical protein [Hypocenomyce scalaris]
MPTYFARSTKVELSVSSLAKSTDQGPLSHRDAQTKIKLQAAASELSNGTVLKEMPIYTDNGGSHMRFLGEHNDMPFFMVRTGKYFFDDEMHGSTNKRSSIVSSPASSTSSCDSIALIGSSSTLSSLPTSTPKLEMDLAQCSKAPTEKGKDAISTTVSVYDTSGDRELRPFSTPQARLVPEPHALTLTVFLSKASFLKTFDRKLEKYITQDVKIDVFFNGELCASTYVPERYRGYANNQTELTQRFSGRRIARLAQRPWVLVPPGQNSDSTLRTNKRSKGGDGAKQRWEVLSSALSVEAGKWGTNRYGELPVVGDYLDSLAKLQMPPELEEWQKPGSPKFGVLDVVVISGKGQKDDSSTAYLSEPTRLRVKGFAAPTAEDIRCDPKPANRSSDLSFPMSAVSVSKQRSRANADAQITAQNVLSLIPRSSLGTSGSSKGDPFIRPRAPSAAPSAVKRRRSSVVGGIRTPDRHAAESKRTPSLPEAFMDEFVGVRVGSSPVSSPSCPLYDPALVPAGAQTVRWSSSPPAVVVAELGLPRSYDGSVSIGGSRNHDAAKEVPAPQACRTRVSSGGDYPWLTRGIQQFIGTRRDGSSDTVLTFPKRPASTRIEHLHTPKHIVPYSGSASSNNGRGKRVFPTNSQSLSPPLERSPSQERLSLNARARLRKGEGSFSRAPVPPVPKSKTPHIAEKRYKGSSLTEEQPKSKRARMAYHTVLTNKMTLAEEMAYIEALSREESLDVLTMATRSSSAATASTTAPSTSSSATPVSTTPVTTCDESPRKVDNVIPSSAKKVTRLSVRNPLHLVQVEKAQQSTPSTAADFIPNTEDLAAITKLPRHPRPTSSSTSSAIAGPSNGAWPTPALSKDCVVTYMDGLTRQVKTERNGWFEERAVLMGVRYLIG